MSSGHTTRSWRAHLTSWSSVSCLHILYRSPQCSCLSSGEVLYLSESFLPTQLSRGGVFVWSGNLTPQPFPHSLLFPQNKTSLSLLLPTLLPPTRESVILSSPLALFHAHISSTLKEDTQVAIASFRSHPRAFLLSSQTPQTCIPSPQSPFTFL